MTDVWIGLISGLGGALIVAVVNIIASTSTRNSNRELAIIAANNQKELALIAAQNAKELALIALGQTKLLDDYKETNKKVDEYHKAVNGNMAILLETTKQLATEKEKQRGEQKAQDLKNGEK